MRGPAENPADGDAVAASLELFRVGRRENWWRDLVVEAAHHGVAPLLAPLLVSAEKARPGCIPLFCRRAFTLIASRNKEISAVRESCVDTLLAGFCDAGLDVLLLKGSALAHMIYAAPELRPMYDIDILIRGSDVLAAKAVAARSGFVFGITHSSRFAGAHHHLPVATCQMAGQVVRLELHTDTMSPDRATRLTFGMLSCSPQAIIRAGQTAGKTLGHEDMLRHLCAHAFEPARHPRLIHLFDIWRYRTQFHSQVDWRRFAAYHPISFVALDMACLAFTPQLSASLPSIGLGMIPLAEISSGCRGLNRTLSALFAPPAWWLRGFYGVPLHRSLLPCRTIRHPATVLRWLCRRLWNMARSVTGMSRA